jgi:hypothetical protein
MVPWVFDPSLLISHHHKAHNYFHLASGVVDTKIDTKKDSKDREEVTQEGAWVVLSQSREPDNPKSAECNSWRRQR